MKSEKKKRYLAKKARRQRALRSARKSADKKVSGSGWTGPDGSGSEAESGSGSELDDSDDDDKASQQEENPKPALSLEEQARQERKAAKAALRDARRDERKALREAQRKAAADRAAREAAKAAKAAAKEGSDDEDDEDEKEDGSDESDDENDDDDEDDDEAKAMASGDEGDVPDLPTRNGSPSPPPLQPFPLPRMAPAPSDTVLSRQGLPTGLADATFIEQDARLGVSDLAESLSAGSAGLSERTQKRLADLGVTDLFAVQAAMLPHLLSLPLVPLPHARLDDFLVSAPTGSGKTLAYAIPIVEVLARRVVPRLRALIVLPTRDLVVQVKDTLEALAKGTGLLVSSLIRKGCAAARILTSRSEASLVNTPLPRNRQCSWTEQSRCSAAAPSSTS
jgi:ATP-dependent RNA helicase DDX51/DBP6